VHSTSHVAAADDDDDDDDDDNDDDDDAGTNSVEPQVASVHAETSCRAIILGTRRPHYCT